MLARKLFILSDIYRHLFFVDFLISTNIGLAVSSNSSSGLSSTQSGIYSEPDEHHITHTMYQVLYIHRSIQSLQKGGIINSIFKWDNWGSEKLCSQIAQCCTRTQAQTLLMGKTSALSVHSISEEDSRGEKNHKQVGRNGPPLNNPWKSNPQRLARTGIFMKILPSSDWLCLHIDQIQVIQT